MSHTEIPVGSRWESGGGFALQVIRLSQRLVYYKYDDDSEGSLATGFFLANMRRIDTPATSVATYDAPTSSVVGVAGTLQDGNDVCAFPGCEMPRSTTPHGACARAPAEDCFCGGKRQDIDCHDFVPQAKDIPIGRKVDEGVAGGPKVITGVSISAPTAPGGGGEPGITYAGNAQKRFMEEPRRPVVSKTETPAPLRHDFSDRYCADRAGLLCVACGWPKEKFMNDCKPVKGWREKYEKELPTDVAILKRHRVDHYQPSTSAGVGVVGGIWRLR